MLFFIVMQVYNPTLAARITTVFEPVRILFFFFFFLTNDGTNKDCSFPNKEVQRSL